MRKLVASLDRNRLKVLVQNRHGVVLAEVDEFGPAGVDIRHNHGSVLAQKRCAVEQQLDLVHLRRRRDDYEHRWSIRWPSVSMARRGDKVQVERPQLPALSLDLACRSLKFLLKLVFERPRFQNLPLELVEARGLDQLQARAAERGVHGTFHQCHVYTTGVSRMTSSMSSVKQRRGTN